MIHYYVYCISISVMDIAKIIAKLAAPSLLSYDLQQSQQIKTLIDWTFQVAIPTALAFDIKVVLLESTQSCNEPKFFGLWAVAGILLWARAWVGKLGKLARARSNTHSSTKSIY